MIRSWQTRVYDPNVDPVVGRCRLETLRKRKSHKWQTYPANMLPAFVAEMDFDLAKPIVESKRAALAIGDCGYGHKGELGEAFAAFAEKRLRRVPGSVPDYRRGDPGRHAAGIGDSDQPAGVPAVLPSATSRRAPRDSGAATTWIPWRSTRLSPPTASAPTCSRLAMTMDGSNFVRRARQRRRSNAACPSNVPSSRDRIASLQVRAMGSGRAGL